MSLNFEHIYSSQRTFGRAGRTLGGSGYSLSLSLSIHVVHTIAIYRTTDLPPPL